MKQWTRVIALKKKSGVNLDFMNILNPTYWPLIGDKAKQFHVGDNIKLSIPNDLNQVNRGGNMPENTVELLNKQNGASGKIISIDSVQGIPGSDAEAMTIQLDNGERLDKFPAAWVVKASKTFKIKKAKTEKESEYDLGYDDGDQAYGAELDWKLEQVKKDFKNGKINKSYYKGFIDGWNDAKDSQ